MSEKQGIITSPNYPNDYDNNLDCFWAIRTRPGRTFTFWFDSFNITSSDTAICNQDYLMLRNGQNSTTSPLMLIHPGQSREQQNGRLCGTQKPARHNSTSNVMSLRLHSDGDNTGKGFRMHYKETDFGCGGQVRLTGDEDSVDIMSPNNPGVPPPHAECIWFVIAPPEHRIQVDFIERFDIRPTAGCLLSGVELKDGGTDFSPTLGSFCGGDRPPTQKSSSNVMRIKYYTNSERPNLGFKAHVSIAKCGGTYHVNSEALTRLHSPLYPARYPPNTQCEWTLIGPTGHFLSFDFDDVNFPSNSNCSLTDRLEFLEPNITGDGCKSRKQAQLC